MCPGREDTGAGGPVLSAYLPGNYKAWGMGEREWGTPVRPLIPDAVVSALQTFARFHPTGLGRVASMEQPVSVGPEEKAALSKMRDRIQYKRQGRE